MAELLVLELGSDAYERGLTHGSSLRTQIAENIDTYLARFAAGGLDDGLPRLQVTTPFRFFNDMDCNSPCSESGYKSSILLVLDGRMYRPLNT